MPWSSPALSLDGSTDREILSLSARLRTAVVVTVAALLAPPGPAGADELRERQDRARAEQKQVKSRLDLARSSDAKVETEVQRLTAAVEAQKARLAEAQRSQRATSTRMEQANRRLAELEAQAAEARRALSKRAVEAYMHGGPTAIFGVMVKSRSLDEAARRQTFLSVVQSRTTDLLNALRSTKQGQAEVRKELQRAHALAQQRAKNERDQAARLATAQRTQETAHAELQKRITHLQEESRQLAAQEGQLQALIRSQEQATQRALAARAQARPAPLAPGRRQDAPGPRPVDVPERPAERAGAPPTTKGSGSSEKAGPAATTPKSPKSKVSGAGLIWPLHGPVTSEFGPRWGAFHSGIDIAAPNGTPIKAAKAGVVIFAGDYGGYGLLVLVDHGGGMVTGYAHQSRIAVSQGQKLNQGQVLGYEGSTGTSTGPHLHFEVRINGVAQNPRAYLSGNP